MGGLCIVLTPFIFSSPKSLGGQFQNPRGIACLNLKGLSEAFRDILKGGGQSSMYAADSKTYIFVYPFLFVSFLFNKVSFFKKQLFSRL